MAITSGHQADLEYVEESSYGVEPASGTLQIPSDNILGVRLEPVNNAEVLYSIGDYDGQSTVTGVHEVVLSFDYILQQVNTSGEHQLSDSIEYYAQYRSSGQPKSLTFYYTPKSGTIYMVNGAVCNSFEMSASADDKTIRCHAEFWGKLTSTSNSHYNDLTSSSAIGTDYEKYGLGSVKRGGSTIESGVTSFRFTISNNLERIPVVGSNTVTSIFAGKQEISGDMDVLVSDGGGTIFGDMFNKNSASLVFCTGSTSSKSLKWTFSNMVYTGVPQEITNDTPFVVSSVPWIAESVSLAGYS